MRASISSTPAPLVPQLVSAATPVDATGPPRKKPKSAAPAAGSVSVSVAASASSPAASGSANASSTPGSTIIKFKTPKAPSAGQGQGGGTEATPSPETDELGRVVRGRAGGVKAEKATRASALADAADSWGSAASPWLAAVAASATSRSVGTGLGVGVGGLGGYGSSGVGGGGGLGLSLPATAVDDDADESENHQAGRVKRVGSGMKHMSDSGYAGHSSSFLANASHTVAVNDADMFPYAGPLLAATRPRVVRWQTQTPQPH